MVSCDLPALTVNSDCYESVGVSVSLGGRATTVLGVYRPPSSPLPLFNENFFSMLTNVGRSVNIVMLGDFNVDGLCESPCASVLSFFDHIRGEHLVPLINLPTRSTVNSESCIDHIYTNSLLHCDAGVFKMLVSDHYGIFCSIPCEGVDVSGSRNISFRDHSYVNMGHFVSDCLLYTSPSPRDKRQSRMPSSA